MKNKSSSVPLILIWVLVCLLAVSPVGAEGEGPDPEPTPESGLNPLRLTPQNPGSATLRKGVHPGTGKLRFLAAERGHAIALPQAQQLDGGTSPEAAAREFISRYGGSFGFDGQAAQLAVKEAEQLSRGRSRVHFQQRIQGIPVLGGELIVHLDAALQMISINGEVLPQAPARMKADIPPSRARQVAEQVTRKAHDLDPSLNLETSPPRLWVYHPQLLGSGEGEPALVWRVQVTPAELHPIQELVLVDAHTGGVALHFNQLDSAKNRKTYDANNATGLPGTLVCDESDPACSAGDSHEQNAHRFAGDTYDFYFNTHGRDSLDDAGLVIRSTTHYGSGKCNAFWTSGYRQAVYYDGCFLVVDDVVAHELTHGVTDHESNLFYYYQSGAINEALSDIWGEFVDLSNGAGDDSPAVRWLIGEDMSVPPFRDMQDPPQMGDPDRMSSSLYWTDAGDNGGVHTNSGIANKAAYLMVDGSGDEPGGTFNGYQVTGLGMDKTAKIFYEVQTNLLTSGSDYGDLYFALYQACLNLVGTSGITSQDCQEVRDATDAVEMNHTPPGGYYPAEAPLCGDSAVVQDLFYDGLESGGGKWVSGSLVGYDRWVPVAEGFAHSGSYSLYSENQDVVSDSYIAVSDPISLPAGAEVYLRFDHAYGLETGYDGGVIEYSTDGGASWLDAGGMVTHNGYRGEMAEGYGNPLAGRSSFTGVSSGYISTRLDLSAVGGQNLRLRWRLGTDQTVKDFGWVIDDIRVYTCSSTAPEMQVRGNGQLIASGDPSPSGLDGTDFGELKLHQAPLSQEFTLHNLGVEDLNLTGTPLVSISGPGAGDFTVSKEPDAVIPGNGATAFQIDFNPSAGGLREAEVHIPSNDADQNPYTFSVRGEGAPIFSDVPFEHWAYDWIETIALAGITAGCGGDKYCPEREVSRAEMAVFLERALKGADYSPPDQAPSFSDTAGHWAEDWIELLVDDGITAGCGSGKFCPDRATKRSEMAVFLLKAKYGAGYTPPQGSEVVFQDVPPEHWAADWIHQLVAEGITAGCGSQRYCPSTAVSRAQMAVLVSTTFGLSP